MKIRIHSLKRDILYWAVGKLLPFIVGLIGGGLIIGAFLPYSPTMLLLFLLLLAGGGSLLSMGIWGMEHVGDYLSFEDEE